MPARGPIMPRRKPASARQNRETRDIGLVRSIEGKVPECPKLANRPMSVGVQEAWVEFWKSDVAGLVNDADLPALRRLFESYELRRKMLAVYMAEPFSTGSTGQTVLHPASREVASLDARIAVLEDNFGITPSARLKLGIVLGAAAKSLEDLNREFNEAGEDEDEDADRYADPRIRIIDASAS